MAARQAGRVRRCARKRTAVAFAVDLLRQRACDAGDELPAKLVDCAMSASLIGLVAPFVDVIITNDRGKRGEDFASFMPVKVVDVSSLVAGAAAGPG